MVGLPPVFTIVTTLGTTTTKQSVRFSSLSEEATTFAALPLVQTTSFGQLDTAFTTVASDSHRVGLSFQDIVKEII